MAYCIKCNPCRFKLRPPRGVLLHGPPGSGKTALARAAAADSGATLLVVNGPDVLTEFYGEGPAAVWGTAVGCRVRHPGGLFPTSVFIWGVHVCRLSFTLLCLCQMMQASASCQRIIVMPHSVLTEPPTPSQPLTLFVPHR